MASCVGTRWPPAQGGKGGSAELAEDTASEALAENAKPPRKGKQEQKKQPALKEKFVKKIRHCYEDIITDAFWNENKATLYLTGE